MGKRDETTRNENIRQRFDKVTPLSNTFIMTSATLTQKGQITVPKWARDAFGWTQETEHTFIEYDDGVKIVAVEKSPEVILERMEDTEWKGPDADELMKETRSEL